MVLERVGKVSDCFAKDKRVEQFWDYLSEKCIDADSTLPPPAWPECSSSSFRTTNACESFHAHFSALFYSAHPITYGLVSALQKIQNEREASLHEAVKYHQQSKMRIASPQKLDSIELTWFRESKWFCQCRIDFYQTPTFSSLSLAFKKTFVTSVAVHIIAQK